MTRLVSFEPHAIKTEKTFASTKPKITILRLLDCDDIVWDTIPDCPDGVIQASDRAIQRLTDTAPAQGSRDGYQKYESQGDVRRQLFLRIDDNYFSVSTTTTS
jgi:hypothetical protein